MFDTIRSDLLIILMRLSQTETSSTSSLYSFLSPDEVSKTRSLGIRIRLMSEDIMKLWSLSRLDEQIGHDLKQVSKKDYLWWIDHLTDEEDLWDVYDYASQEYKMLFIEARLYLRELEISGYINYAVTIEKYFMLIFEIRKLLETSREIRKRLDPPTIV